MPRWVRVFMVIGILLIVLVIVGLVTGQLGPGGQHGPGRHFGSRSAISPSSGVSGAGGPVDASTATRTVQVSALDTMSFEPSAIAVSSGETVTFVVTNAGKAVHEFTLGDAAMQQEHAQAMSHMPAGAAHGFPNSIMLQPGESKQLTWRFGDVGVAYACHQAGHYDAGMRGRIAIG